MSREKRRANPSMNNPVLIGSVGRQLVIRNGAAPYLHTTNDASHQTEFILLHVLTKNLQSIRDECRFQDFVAELDICDFDVCLCCETWRVELQDCIVTPSGCHIFLAGGDERKGVGISSIKTTDAANVRSHLPCIFQPDLFATAFGRQFEIFIHFMLFSNFVG